MDNKSKYSKLKTFSFKKNIIQFLSMKYKGVLHQDTIRFKENELININQKHVGFEFNLK